MAPFHHYNAATGQADRSFAAFFKGLPSGDGKRRVVRVFARDGGSFFSCHSEDAYFVAREYYKTDTVVRDAGTYCFVFILRTGTLFHVLPQPKIQVQLVPTAAPHMQVASPRSP